MLTLFFFFQEEGGIRFLMVTGVQTCALPISALGPPLVRECSPLGATEGAEEDRVGPPAQVERPGSQRVPRRIDRGAADERLLELESDTRPLADRLEDPHSLGGDLLPDAVAGQDRDPVRGHRAYGPISLTCWTAGWVTRLSAERYARALASMTSVDAPLPQTRVPSKSTFIDTSPIASLPDVAARSE